VLNDNHSLKDNQTPGMAIETFYEVSTELTSEFETEAGSVRT
jgi:hypothetical protein